MLEVEFFYVLDQIRGTASVTEGRLDDKIVYTARKIQFFNTDEELNEAGLVREEELIITPMENKTTGNIDWVEFDTNEESELASLIGHEIEKQMQ